MAEEFRFRNGQRVVVQTPNNHERLPLCGMTGTVTRLRRVDYMAWVAMDEPLPEEFRVFDANDSRANHILMDPGECEEFEEAQ